MIYDISQEVFGCRVYPDDPKPEKIILQSMQNDELYNLIAFKMCAHNGTHIDAPFHFVKDGKTVDKICLEAVIGMAYVAELEGIRLSKVPEGVYLLNAAPLNLSGSDGSPCRAVLIDLG